MTEVAGHSQIKGPVDQSSAIAFRVIYLNRDFEQYMYFLDKFGTSFQVEYFDTKLGVMDALEDYYPADVLMAHENALGWELLKEIRKSGKFGNIPFIILADSVTRGKIKEARLHKADDIFDAKFKTGDLVTRLHYFNNRQWMNAEKAARKISLKGAKTPFWKRAIDVIATGGALLLLSPVFLLVALLIRLDSKGPVLYRSKRVGSGFKIFNLLKFRTMRTDADKMMSTMAALNMYNKVAEENEGEEQLLCEQCQRGDFCNRRLFLDGKEICESVYQAQKEKKAAFMKFQNDPRITRIGGFLRNSSLDELPQLVNIFRGDMSLVGNRPLPLYEAEKLTTDDKIMRFAGPAGLTGLWQVTKRGKGKADMSEEERAQLDVTYAKEFSFMLDMKIILKTFPALFQSENV